MKKISKIIKILFAFGMIFSQLNYPLTVFAETISQDNSSVEDTTEYYHIYGSSLNMTVSGLISGTDIGNEFNVSGSATDKTVYFAPTVYYGSETEIVAKVNDSEISSENGIYSFDFSQVDYGKYTVSFELLTVENGTKVDNISLVVNYIESETTEDETDNNETDDELENDTNGDEEANLENGDESSNQDNYTVTVAGDNAKLDVSIDKSSLTLNENDGIYYVSCDATELKFIPTVINNGDKEYDISFGIETDNDSDLSDVEVNISEDGSYLLSLENMLDGTYTLTFKLNESDSLVAGVSIIINLDTSSCNVEEEPSEEVSSDNNVSNVTLSTGTLDKEINDTDTYYVINVDSYVTSITLGGVLSSDKATADGFGEYTLTGDHTIILVSVTAEDGSVREYTFEVVKNYGVGGGVDLPEETKKEEVKTTTTLSTISYSSDSYLDDLIIDGYEIEFDRDTYSYTITVGSDVDSLDITAVLSDMNATYAVYGNSDFQEGENVVTIVVTAEDGSTSTYTITVNKEAKTTEKVESSEEEKGSGSVAKTVVIILIILVIIGLIYLIFKDDSEEDEEYSPKNKSSNKSKKKKN